MTLLSLAVGLDGVRAAAVTPSGVIQASGFHPVPAHSPAPGWVELAPEEIWQAALSATRQVLQHRATTELTALGITNHHDSLLLWDTETLGSPRRMIAGTDRRTEALCRALGENGAADRVAALTGRPLVATTPATRLSWLAGHEPRTWALVEAGQYAIGTVDSYLVARMTRGTWHVTDVSNAARTQLLDLDTGAWADDLCALFHVPGDSLPELVPSWGIIDSTDPRSFCDLSLPIAGLADAVTATLFGQACFEAGQATCTYGDTTTVASPSPDTRTGRDGLTATTIWRTPGGLLAHALEGAVTTPATGDRTADVREVVDRVGSLLDPLPELSALRVAGAATDTLCQAQADRVGKPVQRPRADQPAVLGAAFLAGLGTGVWSSFDELGEAWQLDRQFDPR